MIRMTTRIALLGVVALLVMSTRAHAATRVFVQIGAPPIIAPVPVAAPLPVVAPARVYRAPAPYGYVWRPGYYVWTGYRYRLVPGAWVVPPYSGGVWVGPRWVSRPYGRVWVRGYWRR